MPKDKEKSVRVFRVVEGNPHVVSIIYPELRMAQKDMTKSTGKCCNFRLAGASLLRGSLYSQRRR